MSNHLMAFSTAVMLCTHLTQHTKYSSARAEVSLRHITSSHSPFPMIINISWLHGEKSAYIGPILADQTQLSKTSSMLLINSNSWKMFQLLCLSPHQRSVSLWAFITIKFFVSNLFIIWVKFIFLSISHSYLLLFIQILHKILCSLLPLQYPQYLKHLFKLLSSFKVLPRFHLPRAFHELPDLL